MSLKSMTGKHFTGREYLELLASLPPEELDKPLEIEYQGYYGTNVREVCKPFYDEESGTVIIGKVHTEE